MARTPAARTRRRPRWWPPDRARALAVALLSCLLLAPAALAWHSPHDVIDAMAISPDFAHDRTLFVSLGRFSLLLRSRDAGQSFEVINAGLDSGFVVDLAVSPDFAHDRTLYCAEAVRMFVSHDAGDHWEALPLPPELRLARPIELSPDFARDGTVAVGTGGDGLWISRDRGTTWEQVVAPPSGPASPGLGSVQDVRFSSGFAEDGCLWAVLDGRRMVASSDGGASFRQLASPPGSTLQALERDDASRTLWLGTRAGVLRSTDDGATWQEDGAPAAAKDVLDMSLARDEQGAAVLFVSTATSGVHVRAGDGTWSEHRDGFRPQTDQSLQHYLATLPSPDFARDRTVYAGTFEGLYVSRSGGDGWEWLDVLQPCIVRNLALSPRFADDGTLWLSTYGLGLVEGRTPDPGDPPAPLPAADAIDDWLTGPDELPLGLGSGLAWRRLDTLNWMFPDGIAVSPAVHEDGTLIVGAPNLLVRSTDGGCTAHSTLPLKKAFARSLAFAPDAARSGLAFAYLSTYTGDSPFGHHFARSTDLGATWTEVSQLAAEDMAFATDWEQSGRMYACGQAGLHRSDDRGLVFEHMPSLEVGACSALALAPAAAAGGDDDARGEDTLLVCSRHAGLHLSRDGGVTWEHLDGGLGRTRFHFVELSPGFARDGLGFAGSRTDGIFVTRDGGATWTRLLGGPRVALCMQVSPTFEQDRSVLVGSFDGAWLSRDGGASWTLLQVPLPPGFQPVFSK